MVVREKINYAVFVVSLGAALAVNLYFRSFTIFFPQFKKQAQVLLEQNIRKEAVNQIDQQFKDYNSLVKKRLVNSLVSDYKRMQKGKIQQMLGEGYRKLKDKFQDENGQTYLMELDCWHWGRYVDNVLRLGHPGDIVSEGRQIDTLMLAPSGGGITWSHFLFYLSAFLYKVFSFFKNVPLNTFLFYLPLLFSSVFFICLYLFCCLNWNHRVALITCLYAGLAPVFLSRSFAGWFDTDILNLLLPLLAVWAYLSAYQAASLKRRAFWLFVSGFWTGLFCFTWPNWWFIFFIFIAYEAYSLLNLFFIYLQYKQKDPALVKAHAVSLGLFLIFTFFCVVLFCGMEPWRNIYAQLKEVISLNEPLGSSIWPNVYVTVGELQGIDFPHIASAIGGASFFIFALISAVFLFLTTPRNSRYTLFQREAVIIMIFWLISMFFACFKGVRFSMYLIIPLGLCLGCVIDEIYRHRKHSRSALIIFILATVLFSAKAVGNGYRTASGLFPFMNDTWHKVLLEMKEKTPPDAIINSWWDFGDWFKAVSRRRVIFDGQSQNTPQAYWMARVLLSNDEEEAAGILRMLNNGGNKAFDALNRHFKEPFKSAIFLEKLLACRSKKEKDGLLKELPEGIKAELVRLLFDNSAKAYFLVDSVMQYKFFSVSYVGNWDFIKSYISGNLGKQDKEGLIANTIKFGVTAEESRKLYEEAALILPHELDNWISPIYTFNSGLGKGREKGSIVLFDNGLVYNPKEKNIYIYSTQEKKYIIFKHLFIFKPDNSFEEIIYPEYDSGLAALVFKDKEGYRSMLLSPELAKSMYVRLFFMGGAGLKNFKPFLEESGNDTVIKVFEINWG
ncbi:MAG: hypothetical protein JW788_02540 [Candidatus Omnitrophica bacterium]|nr:hypothetical protein [Candidatus Omnitrophota bacterium]